MSSSLIEIRKLSHQFQGNFVLDQISLNLFKNEIVTLIGPSGCGKSVFLKIILDLLKSQSGEIKKSNELGLISIAFQDSLLFPWLTVRENIEICMNSTIQSKQKKREKVNQLLAQTRLEKFADYHPSELSGGMKQKVNIIRCFANNSHLILMDEPFNSLDSIQRNELQDFTLRMVREFQKTILFVTHDIDEALYLSNRIILFSKSPGRIVNELQIPFARPRTHQSVRTDKEYPEIYARIYSHLQKEVGVNA